MKHISIAKLLSQAEIFEYITTQERATEVLAELDPELVYALDFETTALLPYEGEIRLSSVAGHGHQFIIDHKYAGSFDLYAAWFSKREWAVFNACFEGRWIDYATDSMDVSLIDVQFLRKAKMGGGPYNLALMCKWDLDLLLEKGEQTSNWGNPHLTQSQLKYAMLDAVATFALLIKWRQELTPEQWAGAMVLNDAWRGTAEMEDTGLHLDIKYHKKLVEWWTLKRDTAESYLRKWTPPSILPNLNSKVQISNFLKNELDRKTVLNWPVTGKRGDLQLERDTLRLAAYNLPYPMNRWLTALIIYNKQNKYISTYGDTLINSQTNYGKVSTRFNMAQAVTGRYSSSKHNLQNIPNNVVVRRSFIVPPRGEGKKLVLVMADYSSIEVRVLAELSGDKRLLEDAVYGDVHARSASQIFNIDFDEFVEVLNSDDVRHDNIRPIYKSYRTRAKSFTFQLLYGAGATALAVVLKTTPEEAAKAIIAWAEIYPDAYHYREIMFEKMMFDGFMPVKDGRTMYVPKWNRSMPIAANWPIQGAAASVMYRAVDRTHRSIHASNIQMWMAATVHDELLTYARKVQEEEAAELLINSMIAGWLDIFPGTDTNNLLGKGNQATIGTHWGDK